MYKSIICVASIALLASCGNKNSGKFELKGNFTDSKGETIYLEKLANPKPVIVDSAMVDDQGNFEFTNYVPKIGFYRVMTTQQNFGMLVLDSADKVELTASIKDIGNSYKVKGSAETELFMEYAAMQKKRDLRIDSLNKAFQMIMETHKMDSAKMDEVSKTFEGPYNSIVNSYYAEATVKIKKNTDKYASIMAIQSMEPDKFSDLFIALDAGLSKKFPNDRNIVMFHEMVVKRLAISAGKEAPEINLPTPDGNSLALSSLRGKVVLIDFWASWCGPCRREMPNVVRAYNKYKGKGFEIFGVSLDKDKENWVKAIAEEGITWPQVSDLQYWNSEVVRLYSIEGIPFTVLLDKEGKIIAKNLRGDELDKKLAEVLN